MTTTDSALDLIARCLVGEPAAWAAFMAEFRGLFAAVRAARNPRVPEAEFLDWVPGWLVARRKLHSLYRALLRKTAEGALTADGTAAAYARNYLARMAASAVADYATEFWPIGTQELTDIYEARPDTPAEHAVGLDRMRGEVARLRATLRIPFWLKFAAALGPLPPDDLRAVAASAQLTEAEVRAEIEAELAANAGAVHEMSSQRIGRLLTLPPDVNGKYAAVDQRVGRAKALLRIVFNPPPPEDDP